MEAEFIKELVTAEVISASSPYAVRAHIVDLCTQLAEAQRERDEAREELNAHVGKQALKEMIRQMWATSAERDTLRQQLAEATAQAAGYREALEDIASGEFGLDVCRDMARTILAAPPSEHLERLRAEAQADWLRAYIDGLSNGNKGDPGSVVAILREELARLEAMAK